MTPFIFKKYHSVEDRRNEAERITSKYPGKVPIILESYSKTLVLDKNKYLVPNDLSIGQFIYVIRKRIKLEPEKALFLFINNTLHSTSSLVSHIYTSEKDVDGFLYCMISEESTFGFLG